MVSGVWQTRQGIGEVASVPSTIHAAVVGEVATREDKGRTKERVWLPELDRWVVSESVALESLVRSWFCLLAGAAAVRAHDSKTGEIREIGSVFGKSVSEIWFFKFFENFEIKNSKKN
jgi:hypothetical protein